MRYDTEVDLDDENTSHGLVVGLVGTGKRVLDVGCATGYLAKALVERGNVVCGVEIDPKAAERARPYLEKLVVADLDAIDLVTEFGTGSFDVIVFADVLEHLKDPLAVLARSRTLLADGGHVVVSLPNVAHAAVRLALLNGQFDYSSVGLLDRTHLRFFTRASLDEFLGSAGFVPIEMRRTTSPPFDTEIVLSPEDFPPEILRQVALDPDSTTYQFVFSAVPFEGGGDRLADQLATQAAEVGVLRERLAEIGRALSGIAPQPTIGVVSLASVLDLPAVPEIRLEVVLSELRRRLAAFAFRAYSMTPEATVSGLQSDPVWPISPADEQSGHSFSGLAAVVVATPEGPDPMVERSVTYLDQAGPQIVPVGVDAGGRPDPVALAGRVLDRHFLQRREAYLRLTGFLPSEDGFLLVHVAAPDGAPGGPDRVVAAVARRRSIQVVKVPVQIAPVDLVASVFAAELVVTDSPSIAALAAGLCRPVIALDGPGRAFADWAGPAGLAVATPEELVAVAGEIEHHRPEEIRDSLFRILDLSYDELAGSLVSIGSARLAQTFTQRIADLARRVGVLEEVNRGLRDALARDRISTLRTPDPPGADTGVPVSPSEEVMGPVRTRQALMQAEARVEHLEGEIDRIYATRVMRTVRPMRRMYSRLRSRHR